MPRPRPSDSIRTIIEGTVSNTKVEAISIIPTKRLLRAFKVKLADERTLLLNLSPPTSRLLRSEQWLLESEAALIRWLLEDSSQQRNNETPYLDDEISGKSSPRGTPLGRWSGQPALDSVSSPREQLASYLPTMIRHSTNAMGNSLAFNLLGLVSGDPISTLGKPLTPVEREHVDFQKGRLMRRIANITSPNGKFGPVVTVLGKPRAPESTQTPAREIGLDCDGADSWRKTFHLLLEGVLRDGEDLAVTMSYELVRTTFHKFGHLLDAITMPRLVACNVDEDDVVLVSRPEEPSKRQGQKEMEASKSLEIKLEPDEHPDDKQLDEDGSTAFEITGLRDWSNCIFGDPLFATVFSHATPDFERGFREPLEPHAVKREDKKSTEDNEQQTIDIIEDPDNSSTRILLYECYHATVSIVRQFYRPDANSSEREIAARRRLVAALAKLENIDVGESTNKRPRKLSNEDWPVKRPRGDTPIEAE
ncbi:hypothetical protein F4802DRAFT_604593 [Xylaria palmicola]|nr:hypothetical protein F4802DRAFT_604593 [Xylaria palmicola]